MDAPALSVIVRTLGRSRLGEALESLARQTRRDFEVVVVDMSEGAAAPVVDTWRSALPQLVHVEAGRRLRRPDALNKGIRRASAPAIAVLDDDNLFAPEHVDTLAVGLAATGADLVYTNVRRQTFTPDGELINELLIASDFDRTRLLFGNFIYATSTAFTRRIWRTVGGYDSRFPVYEDWEFLIRVAHAGRIAAIAGTGAISRNFTGDPTRSAHNDEVDACARSIAGVFWTHRDKYPDRIFEDHPDLVAISPHVPRGSVPRRARARLADWWWKDGIGRYLGMT